ncbi:FAD-binding and (Fe-S)-binding domain-containing protein [Nesterenkonia ebinurensis]|uniref:FAD-binding and (Fe-S)-binding domain-containing protein n=1 Tax=Nesterenkonia ebinurensis TaxID=2608252 RepID=UPI00123C91E8|nr:FAD-binding and (Fe-S)-binding domain-containing protein [Nesterenkonia ebinurensis]
MNRHSPHDEVDSTLATALRGAVAEVSVRAIDRFAAAHDASHYRMTPQVLVKPTTIDELAALFAECRERRMPLTFRSGGTSLSGQSVTESVLVDTRRHFRQIEVLNGGTRVRCGPGAVLRNVNARLIRHGRKLGPDPASEIACTIGGVVANNSSGMACGIESNTYQTLDSAVLVLPSGTVVDTGTNNADAALRRDEPEIHAGLAALRDRLRGDQQTIERIEALHSIKNTMGYGLNSFLDYDEPVKILEHLCIGSEGTLAFIAEATFCTVTVKPHVATGLLIFEDLRTATAALPDLVAVGPATVELMDATSLRVAQQDPNCPREIVSIDLAHHCALLVEFQEAEDHRLTEKLNSVALVWQKFPPFLDVEFSSDPGRRSALWATRKGLFAAVASNRPSGTTALLEDIAVPMERLGETCEALTMLFDAYGYDDAVIFGHAKDGNIHFMITEQFSAADEVDEPNNTARRDLELDDAEIESRHAVLRYRAFTEDLVDLVLSQGGTLKAEHGTGRMMAPFVPRQVGQELYRAMWEVKDLIDPEHLLNPGVLLTEDPHAHLRNLKTAPGVEEEVDRCVECGYCEPVCPSKDLTTTPRERIVIRREIARADAEGHTELAATLRGQYEYEGLDTCAVDGMCQTACPVFINTGDLVRRLREENTSRLGQRAWNAAAHHWHKASALGSLALTSTDKLPSLLPVAASSIARKVAGEETVPQYSADLPTGGEQRVTIENPQAEIVWFSSCTNTIFGPGEVVEQAKVACGLVTVGVADSFRMLCERAGIEVCTPEGVSKLCCGTPWKSKGYHSGYQHMRQQVIERLNQATDGGRIPVVSDASSCTEGLAALLDGTAIEVIDVVHFTADRILPNLPEFSEAQGFPSLTLHPTCSSSRIGLNPALVKIAEAISEDIYIPESWNCCAFAGDRGMLRPELTESATKLQATEVRQYGAAAHASTNRTCEIGMSRATGIEYRHILELLVVALP